MNWREKLLWSTFAITGIAIGGFIVGPEEFKQSTRIACICVMLILSFDYLQRRGPNA